MTRRRIDTATGELFCDIPSPMPTGPGTLDLRKRFAGMVSDAIAGYRGKDSDSSKRYHIAARMSELCEHDTSKALIDAYSAPSRDESNLPAWKLPAFEVATSSRIFTEFMVGFHGGRVLWGKDVLQASLGDVETQIQALMEQRIALRAAVRRIK